MLGFPIWLGLIAQVFEGSKQCQFLSFPREITLKSQSSLDTADCKAENLWPTSHIPSRRERSQVARRFHESLDGDFLGKDKSQREPRDSSRQ
jgi:hypothetical protein